VKHAVVVDSGTQYETLF